MIQWLYHSAFLIVLSVRLAHPSKSLMLQASLTYMCSSSLGPFPGLAALTSGISSFFFSPFHWGWSSFFSPAFTFFFPPLLLTLSQVCYCRLPLLLVLMSTAPELEAGRTHTDEVGRSKAAPPTLSSGASAKERVFLFLLVLISVLLPIS